MRYQEPTRLLELRLTGYLPQPILYFWTEWDLPGTPIPSRLTVLPEVMSPQRGLYIDSLLPEEELHHPSAVCSQAE
jgi:hypothetical protein